MLSLLIAIAVAVPEKGFDLALTAKQPPIRYSLGPEHVTNTCHALVPATEYVGAKVRFTVNPDPALDRTFTLRLTRFVHSDKVKARLGRAVSAMAQVRVETDRIAKRLVGRMGDLPLYEAEFPVDCGDIQDIIFTDSRGTHLEEWRKAGRGRYLDIEFLGRLHDRCGAMTDARTHPVRNRPSAVTIFGCELEETPCELETRTVVSGNVFEPGDPMRMTALLRVKKPGEYRLVWTVSDAEGRVVRTAERRVSKSETFDVDLSGFDLGWYALDYALYAGDRRLVTHAASFAVLPKDTRTSEWGEAPYGSWDFAGAHYTAGVDEVGPLLRKAGFRRCWVGPKYTVEKAREYKIAPVVPMLWNRANAIKDDAKLVAALKDVQAQYPMLKSFEIFHESLKMPGQYCQAPESVGAAYDPKYALTNAPQRLADAKRMSRLVRENFPEWRITLGNSLCSTEIVAEMMRTGFPKDGADYMGLEQIGRSVLPEREWDGGLQAADWMRTTARHFGYDWKVNACFESNYRRDALLGVDRQAAWYVRDLLLSQCWGFIDIFIGLVADVGNEYASSYWGTSGHCVRAPYHYPKKSYVTIATATRLLDRVTATRTIPTGDDCVYAVDFTCAGGRHVTAFWTSRGTAELTLKGTAAADFVDGYGRALPKTDRLVVDGLVKYALTETAPDLTIACGKRTYPDDVPPADTRTVVSAATAAVSSDAETRRLLEKDDPTFPPYRVAGKGTATAVVDEERGSCLEVSLPNPDLSLSTRFSEYVQVAFPKPVPLAGDPATLGVWVRGNSGWGNVYFVIEDAKGRRRVSCGTRAVKREEFDYDGRMSLCYTGWAYLSLPVAKRSSVPDLSSGTVTFLWEFGKADEKGVWKRVEDDPVYPIKLVGLVFDAASRPLYLTERRLHGQTIRLGDVCGSDFAK